MAVAQRSPHLVLSHASAAVLHGLPIWDIPLDRVHLTRAGRGGSRQGPGRTVHAGSLDPREVTTFKGVRVTSVSRTLVDLGCTAGIESTVIAADFALRCLITPAQLGDSLADLGHRRGVHDARRALGFADGRAESPGESLTRVALNQAGLPPPVLQVHIYSPSGAFLGRVDLGYPELGVLIEFDGRVKYRALLRPGQAPEDAVIDEKRREDALREMGYLVIRFVWADVRDPAAMAARVTRGMARAKPAVASGGIVGRWKANPPLRIPASTTPTLPSEQPPQ